MGPENPDRLKVEADHLLREGKTQEAGAYLEHAARLFLDSGRLLQAVAAKKLKWQRLGWSPEQERELVSALEFAPGHTDAFSRVLRSLSAPAKAMWIRYLEVVGHPQGAAIKRSGDPETALYFVVDGGLRESTDPGGPAQSGTHPRPERLLSEGDHFGDVYPLSETRRSRSQVDTVTRSDLLRISKRNLVMLCSSFAEMEPAIIELCGVRRSHPFANRRPRATGTGPTVRKGGRYRFIAGVTVEVENGAGAPPTAFSGLTYDVSVSGMCFIPSGEDSRQMSVMAVKNGEKAKVRVILNTDTLSVAIRGEIVRLHRIVENGALTPAVAIRFADMPPALKVVFFAFAHHLNETNQTKQDRDLKRSRGGENHARQSTGT